MVAGEWGWAGPALAPDRPLVELPGLLRRCRRVVAATVLLPEFLVATAGLVQRLSARGVRVDVLVAAAGDPDAERAGGQALGELSLTTLCRHRLALPAPLGDAQVDDLLAGLSELVGFAPEPGVYCLAPTCDGSDPSRALVGQAAQRVAEAYRLPLIRYAAPAERAAAEVELAADEWSRKSAALAVCAPGLAPLDGQREYFTY